MTCQIWMTVQFLLLMTSPTTAAMTITACGDAAGIRDRDVTLTILDRGLTWIRGSTGMVTRGDIAKGAPLMITVNSDEAAPTLSFSPTDVTINEGGSTETVLLAEGPNATEVGMVKLMVEGDAMVSLMQDGEMLEEMGGYVYVDLGDSNSARLMAMSHSDPDLMDGDIGVQGLEAHGRFDGRQHRRGLLVQGRRHGLDRRAGAAAGWPAPSGSVPDGRRRAAVSSAPGIAPSSHACRGTVYTKGGSGANAPVPPSIYLASAGFQQYPTLVSEGERQS